jgi:hypothetical protein
MTSLKKYIRSTVNTQIDIKIISCFTTTERVNNLILMQILQAFFNSRLYLIILDLKHLFE